MKSELKAKFLQHLAAKKSDNAGFTLIELLVVIIIIGILSAIALPSFLNQANKARQSEAKTYVGSINRGQQAYYLENNEFGGNISVLGIGVKTGTENYSYATEKVGTAAALTTGTPGADKIALRAYVGGVQLTQVTIAADGTTPASNDESTTLAVLCEALNAGTTALTATDVTGLQGTRQTTEISCNTGTTKSLS